MKRVKLIWAAQFCGYEEAEIEVVDNATEKDIKACFPAILGLEFDCNCKIEYITSEDDNRPYVTIESAFFIAGRGTTLVCSQDLNDDIHLKLGQKVLYKGQKAPIFGIEQDNPTLVTNNRFSFGLVFGGNFKGVQFQKGDKLYILDEYL